MSSYKGQSKLTRQNELNVYSLKQVDLRFVHR